MVQGRFGPLIALVFLVVLALCARLFQLQVLEHGIWAGEAARLVRSGQVVPGKRGAILDAKGRVLVRDEPAFSVEFGYRDFRRGHPLAQVAHGCSSLLGRSVTLAEALANLRGAARALVLLDPGALEGFARGRGLAASGFEPLAPAEDPGLDQSASRAADVRFYVEALLELEDGERRELRSEISNGDAVGSFAEFAARARRQSLEAELAELDLRLARSVEELERLGALIGESGVRTDAQRPAVRNLADLIAEIEGWRARVEEEAASELFRQAAGFAAGRVEPALLVRAVDLAWVARVLRWDAARTAQWVAREREEWRRARDTWQVEALLAELQLARADEGRAEVLVAELAAMFGAPSEVAAERERALAEDRILDVRALEELSVLCELDDLFEVSVPAESTEERERVLPLAWPAFTEGAWSSRWHAIAALELLVTGSDLARLDELAAAWRENVEERLRPAWVRERVLALCDQWEELLQRQIARELDAALAAASPAERGASGRLLLDRARIALAGEQIPYILKDRGNRPFEVVDDPPYALVWMLSRHRDRFPGFAVRPREERVPALDTQGAQQMPASLALLLGHIAQPDMLALVRQKREARELDELLRLGRRSAGETERLRELVARVDRPGEQRGADGIEGYFDEELCGEQGYREIRGLSELAADEAAIDLAARDGDDVVLTLDLDLQRAAEQVLLRPAGDPEPSKRDDAWLARPVGAIVLLRPDGDVLAAASVPTENRGTLAPRSHEDTAVDRTLRMFDNQPPGSVFKPFIAAWALDRIDLDRHASIHCAATDGDTANYKGLHCHNLAGHGTVDLSFALEASCNGYFAWLGEQVPPELLIEGAREFGFGEPTGVRCFGPRRGLREDAWPQIQKLVLRNSRDQRLFGNGLSVVQATPMQVARAYAALATGELPELRLVHSIGGRAVERRARPLDISAESLEFVRRELIAVTAEVRGTAHASLSPQALGFALAAKTGSADYKQLPGSESAEGDNKVRKHTWLAGWFPAEDPVAIVVVFEFDTLVTSSHGAVWVAREFLQRPEVRALADAERRSD